MSAEITVRPRTDANAEVMSRHLADGGATQIRFLIAEIDGDEYTVTMAREPVHQPRTIPDYRWHISVAGMGGVPPWNVMAALAHELRPGVPFCVPVPPRSQWMNYNERVLHLYEIKDGNLTEQWRVEGRGHTPS